MQFVTRKKLEMNESVQLVRRLEDGQFSAALLGFKRLDPRDKAFSSEVVTTATLITKKIEAAAHNGVQDIPLSVVMAVSQILGQFQLLRLVVSTSKSESGLLNDFADNLAHYSEENGEPFTRKRWIQEFLQGFLQGITRFRMRQASWLDVRCFSVVKSLVKFRDEKHLAITQRANCASACLAIHMQHYVLGFPHPHYSPNAVKALTVFGTVLSRDPHVVGRIAINGELCLGMRFGDNKSRIANIGWEEGRKWYQFKAKSIEDFEKAFSSSAQYDQARLDELVIEDDNRNPVEVGYWGRIVISRGCTAILIIFLSSMKAFPLPEDTLELTLETLQIITKSLTAAYSSSSSTQTVLIHLIDWISKHLHAQLMQQDRPSDPPLDLGAQKKEEEGDIIQEIHVGATDAGGAGASISNTTEGSLNTTEKYFFPMLQTFFDVIGTIAHPDSIEEAKKVVTTIRDDFTAYDVHTNAVNVLAKV